MQEPLEHPAEEIKRLQRCINDLVSVLALPAIWTGSGPSRVISTLLDTLLGMLRLDFVWARLNDRLGEAPFEMVRSAPSQDLPERPQQIGERIGQWLRSDPSQWPAAARIRIGVGDFSIVPLQMGLHAEIGVIVAGSQRPDFPNQTERLLLSVAANQAAIGLREAQILSEQKRAARELDRRVAQRTKELAQSNEELKLQVGLLQHLPVSAWTLKPDGTPDFVNQVWLEFSGQTLDFVRSHPEAWMTAVHPEDREAASRVFWEGVRSGQGFAFETRSLRAKDGTWRWHLNQAVVLRDPEGKVLKFVGTSTDIEDVKQSQENLRRVEERTRLIIDTAMDAVITMDSLGTITSWNKQAEIVFGWSDSEAIGRHMAELIIPGPQRTSHERGLRHFLATGEGPILGRRVVVTAIRRSGVEFPAELEVAPLKLGQDWIFSAFIRDITESKCAEEQLRRSEAILAEGQRLSSTGSFSWRLDTDEVSFSQEACRIFDFEQDKPVTLEQIVGRVHQDDIPLLSEKMAAARTAGDDQDYEIRLRMPDGRVKCLHTVARATRYPDGRLEYIGVIQDVTERRLAEEALNKLQSELAHVARFTSLGALTASIAHEVNQPLAGIVMNASTCLRMLAADPPNVDGARETARRTIRDGERATDVIRRLRTLFTRKGIALESVDVNEATREVVALSQNDLQRNQVILRQELAENLPLVTGDRVQLQQVILNLLRNASDAMSGVEDRARLLILRTELDAENCVRLSVQDKGVGIDLPDPNRLFDAFYTTKTAGMGIGLSVSRSIIESHHGRLWAERNDGPGATFSFSLPGSTESRNPGSAEASVAADGAQLTRDL